MYIQAKTFPSIHKQFHPSSTPTKQPPVHEVGNPQTTDFSIKNLISYPTYLLRYQHPTNQPTNREKYLMGNGKCDGQGIEYCCIIAQLPAAKEVSLYLFLRQKKNLKPLASRSCKDKKMSSIHPRHIEMAAPRPLSAPELRAHSSPRFVSFETDISWFCKLDHAIDYPRFPN
jgi:hypothetical protein